MKSCNLPLKIYFAGSIRGGREDAKIYKEIIEYLNNFGEVLTEHVGLESVSEMGENHKSDKWIYNRDMGWIHKADFLIAEVTQPSLGVGYELGQAQALKIPILCLFDKNSKNVLSAMIKGNSYNSVRYYQTLKEAKQYIEKFLFYHNKELIHNLVE